MSKSHKLFIAVALLAGGYGLALVWNATVDYIWPNAKLLNVAGGQASLHVDPTFATPWSPSNGARLVPESQSNQAARQPATLSTALSTSANDFQSMPPRAEYPTWLSASRTTQFVSSTTSPAVQSAAPSVGSEQPPAASNDSRANGEPPPECAAASPNVSARITEVKPVQESAVANGSPWDRWPRWEPDMAAAAVAPTTATGAPDNRVVGASADQTIAPASVANAVQASFSAPADRTTSRLQFVPQSLASSDDGDDGPRTHTIIDGDSLAKLAERFLGDPRLGDEIYQLNRDVLKSPELLPIGVDLKLPPRPLAGASRAAPAHSTASAAASNSTGLFPVEDVRKAFVGMPRAQLLRPLPPIEESKSPAMPSAIAASGH